MSDQNERRAVSNRDLIVLVSLLIGGIGLMYLGRGVVLYHGSWLSGGLGAMATVLGGGDAETARGVVNATARREPTLSEQVLFYSGCAAMLLNVVEMKTGMLTHLMEVDIE